MSEKVRLQGKVSGAEEDSFEFLGDNENSPSIPVRLKDKNKTDLEFDEGALPVRVQDQYSETVDLYLHKDTARPTLTGAISVDDTTFQINSNAGISNGDALTIYEDSRFYQTIVESSAANSVAVKTPCDKEFTTNATIVVGAWNMAVNGSAASPQEFKIFCPPTAQFDIYGFIISGLDDLEMDSSTFLGIVNGITNGLLLRFQNGIKKNLGLFVNNLGFSEYGCEVTYIPANKKSQYGILVNKSFKNCNGVSIRMDGSQDDEFEMLVRDDLSTQTLMAAIIKGHIVE